MEFRARLLIAVLAVICIIAGTWMTTNYEPQRVGVIFTVLGAVVLLGALLEKQLLEITGAEAPDDGDAEINPGRQAIGGIALGLIFILVGVFSAFSITIPHGSLSTAHGGLAVAGEALISILGAPLLEEPFFLFFLPLVIFALAYKFTNNHSVSILLVLLLVSVIFALYHWIAYDASTLTAGAFFGAAIFRFITLLLVVLVSKGEGFSTGTVAPVIITAIIMHIMFNAFLYGKSLSIVGVPIL